MRKGILIAVLLLVIAVIGSAQTRISFYAGGGANMPVSGELGDYFKMSYGFSGAIGVQVIPMIEIVARISYNPFPLDGDAFLSYLEDQIGETLPSGLGIDGLDMTLIAFGVDVKFLIPTGNEDALFKPYLVAGAGSTSRNFSDLTLSYMGESATLTPEDMDIETGSAGAFSFGGGFEYMLSPRVGIWIDARYAIMRVDPENYGYIPIRGGLKFLF